MRRAVVACALVAASLAGLAVAASLADSITMRPRAAVVRSNEFAVGVLGTISSSTEGEYVTVQGKECGVPGAFFRALVGSMTTAGGAWEASVPIRTRTTLRAEWKGAQSASVVVQRRAGVGLSKEKDGFRVGVSSETGSADRKRVRIERLTSAGWKALRTVVVRSEGYTEFAEKDGLRFQVPRGTLLRAVLPRAQAGPCYLAGYSKLVRT